VNLSITVNDGANPVNGANVSIGTISSTTGSQGGCTLQNVPTGYKTITIVADGFTEYTEVINISSENTVFTFSLTQN